MRLEYLKNEYFFRKATFKVSGTSYLEDTKKTIGDSYDHQTAIVNIGNPYYVYGGTWKTCTGLSNSGAKYLVFSPLVPSKQEKNILVLLSLYFFDGSVFTFQFLNDKIHNYVKKITMIVNFIIQKLKTN